MHLAQCTAARTQTGGLRLAQPSLNPTDYAFLYPPSLASWALNHMNLCFEMLALDSQSYSDCVHLSPTHAIPIDFLASVQPK